MTASKKTESKNPFDEVPEGKNTRNEEPKGIDVDKKVDNKVVESKPENVGTEDAGSKVEPSATAKIDADKADEANAQKKAAAATKKAETSGRRTAAQKKADDIESAKKLLGSNGFRVSETSDEEEQPDVVENEDHSFDDVDFEKLPLSAVSGQIVGSVSLNQGAVPTLSIALQNWIGEPPVSIAASQIGDVEKVLSELKKQAKKAKHD